MSYALIIEAEQDSRFTTLVFGPFETEQAAWAYAIKNRSEEAHPEDCAHEVLELKDPNG